MAVCTNNGRERFPPCAACASRAPRPCVDLSRRPAVLQARHPKCRVRAAAGRGSAVPAKKALADFPQRHLRLQSPTRSVPSDAKAKQRKRERKSVVELGCHSVLRLRPKRISAAVCVTLDLFWCPQIAQRYE